MPASVFPDTTIPKWRPPSCWRLKGIDNNPAHIVLAVDDMTATMSRSIVAKTRAESGARHSRTRFRHEHAPRGEPHYGGRHFRLSLHRRHGGKPQPQSGGNDTDYIHYVGNILIDTIRFNRHRLIQPAWFSTLGLKKGVSVAHPQPPRPAGKESRAAIVANPYREGRRHACRLLCIRMYRMP